MSEKTPAFGFKKSAHPPRQDELDPEQNDSFGDEEITGSYEGSRVPSSAAARVGRLEKKHDELKSDVKEVRNDVKKLSSDMSNLRADVSGAVGKLDGQSGVLTEVLSIVKKTAERDHATLTAKVEVDKAQELARVEIGKAQELAKVEVTKEEQVAEIEVLKETKVDLVKAKGDRRKRNLKILALLASGGGVVEVLHRLWEML